MAVLLAQDIGRPEENARLRKIRPVEETGKENYNDTSDALCDLDILQNIWETKEYRIFPRSIMRHLRQDTNLSDAAILCWQTLFELAYFNKNWEIDISKGELAKEMNKSTSTIARLLTQLEQLNYIAIHHNRINQVWQSSTITVRFPKKALETIKQENNRNKKVNLSDKISYNVKPSNVHLRTSTIVIHGKENIINQSNTMNHGLLSSNVDLLEEGKGSTPGVKNAIQVCSQLDGGISIFEESNNTILNNYKNTNNNSETVVVCDSKCEKKYANELNDIQDCELLLKNLEELRRQAEHEWVKEKDRKQMHDKMRRFHEIDSAYRIQQMKLERLQKISKKEMQLQHKHSQVNQDIDFVKNKKGERPISDFTFKRMLRTIESLGYQGDRKIRLVNEILFEVRFGSLINCNRTQLGMTVDHSVNVALKLVREGRWCKPIAFDGFFG